MSRPFLSPLDRRILFVMPSGPAAMSDGRRFIISLTSSRVVVLLSLGSGMCESKGVWCVECLCDTVCFSFVPRRKRAISKVVS